MPENVPHPGEIEIFFSYAHEDEELRDKLAAHLAPLRRAGRIKEWHDRKILAGKNWKHELDARINSAHVILLLVSADFFNSEYCWGEEMARALERHAAGEAHVIPIILRECDWSDHFGHLQVLPEGGVPCTSAKWGRLDRAFTSVALGIKRALDGTFGADAPPGDGGDEEELSMIPYLCDRAPQEERLGDVLESPLQERSARPVVCIIYGGEEECHDKYRERLQQRSLQDLMGGRTPDLPIEDYMLNLPRSFESAGAFAESLRKTLGVKLLRNRRATKKELSAAIGQFKAPVIVHSVLSTEEWEPHGPEVVGAYLRFWDEGWELPAGPHLYTLLHIEYNRKRQDFILNEPKVEEFIARHDWAAYGNVHAVCLPKLSAIPESDAKDWLRDEANFADFCRVHRRGFCDVSGGVEGVGRIYRGGDALLPMQVLAPQLRRVLKEYRCRKHSRRNS